MKNFWRIPAYINVGMARTTNRAVEILRGPDGERIYFIVIDYALKLARRYGWRSDLTLPQGKSPDEIAKDVVIKVLEGRRSWDEAKEPSLLNALKGMVKSDMGHLFEKSETRRVEPIERTLPDGKQRTADSLADCSENPEDSLIQAERVRLEMTALDMIREKVEGDAELELVFLALYESSSPSEIARLTQIPVGRVYVLGRQLNNIASKITPEKVARVAREKRRGKA